MGAWSNHALVVTILAYLAAMVCHAVEYAFGARGAVARAAVRDVDPVAAGPPPASGPAVLAESAVAKAGNPMLATAGVAAVGCTVIGVAAHVATLAMRGLAAQRVPWGNMYEFVVTVCLVGAVVWVGILAVRPRLRHLGLFVMLVLVVLLGIAGMDLYTGAGPLVPALNSYWLKIHVTAAATAAGLFLIGFVLAALTVVRGGYDAGRPGFPFRLGDRLPSGETLERLAFRVHALAFPIWTFAIIAGAVWAEAAWGRYWGWDPKETWSFIAWVVYAGYLHARATPSVRRSTVTWIALAGWAAMMINLFGVNLVISGLHSYAGV